MDARSAVVGNNTKFIDARLVSLAFGIWIANAFVMFVGSSRHPLALQLWLLVIVFGLTGLGYSIKRFKLSNSTIIKMAMVGVTLGTLMGLVRITPLVAGSLQQSARQQQVIQFAGVIQNDPIVKLKRGGLDWQDFQQTSVAIRLESFGLGAKRQQVRVPALLFASNHRDDQLVDAIPGSQVTGFARLQVPKIGRPYAVYLVAVEPIKVHTSAPRYQRYANLFRNALVSALQHAPNEGKQLVPGLALGDSRNLSDSLASQMRGAGLTHLIAVSGANVSVLFMVILWLMRRFSKRAQFFGAILALSAFVIVVRPQPSVMRAAVMGMVVMIGSLMRRRVDSVVVLSTAVICLLLLDPFLSLSYGFALSVAATGGLLVWSKNLLVYLDQKMNRRIPRWILEGLAVTICAQVAVAPLLLEMGSRMSLASLPANLLCVPLASIVMLMGIPVAIVALPCLPLAQILIWVAVIPACAIAKIAQWTSALTWLVIPWPHGFIGSLLWIVFMVTSALLIRFRQRFTSIQLSAIATSILFFMSALWFHPHVQLKAWPPRDWVMVSCDVGQGDATVLSVAPHQAVVIDAGPDAALVDQCLDELQVREIPLLILTHFHADHVGGIEGVLQGRTVGMVRTSPLFEPGLTYAFATSILRKYGTHFQPMTAGEHLHIGDIDLHCLWPSQIIRGQGSGPNNASLVLLARIGSHNYMLTGDVETTAQHDIDQAFQLTHIDVLKVAHHGSRKQDVQFARDIAPTIAFISVGVHNDYGHPDPETIKLYESLGTTVYRTDLQGALAVVDPVRETLSQKASGIRSKTGDNSSRQNRDVLEIVTQR